MALIDRPGARPFSPTTPSTTGPSPTTGLTAPTDATTVPPVPAGTPGMPTSDGFAAGGAATRPARGGLPDLLQVTPCGARVVHGSDPGDFYCEHAFFLGQEEARRAGSSVVVNAQGEPLVGFLHVPPDPHTYRDPDPSIDAAARHKNLRSVIGAALKGYFEQAKGAVQGDVRILLTGYLTFHSVKNNPTGDFVARKSNLDAALKEAFGDALLTPSGEKLPDETELMQRYRYRVKDATGAERSIVIEARRLPVSDAALDADDDRSIPNAVRTFGPHAILSMGVAGGPDFMAEFHADDGGLDRTGGARHDGSRGASTSHADNYSLARAIHLGSQGQRASVRDLHISSRLGGPTS